jgi:hypothetical protein
VVAQLDAGPNTLPTIAISVLAIMTGQMLGALQMTVAPVARTASAKMMRPRVARVASMVAPMGVWAARPSGPPVIVTNPTASCVQCCWVTRNTLHSSVYVSHLETRNNMVMPRHALREITNEPGWNGMPQNGSGFLLNESLRKCNSI